MAARGTTKTGVLLWFEWVRWRRRGVPSAFGGPGAEVAVRRPFHIGPSARPSPHTARSRSWEAGASANHKENARSSVDGYVTRGREETPNHSRTSTGRHTTRRPDQGRRTGPRNHEQVAKPHPAARPGGPRSERLRTPAGPSARTPSHRPPPRPAPARPGTARPQTPPIAPTATGRRHYPTVFSIDHRKSRNASPTFLRFRPRPRHVGPLSLGPVG